jgi:predicted RNase H-like nuclease
MFVGVDACSSGWVAVSLGDGTDVHHKEDFDQMHTEVEDGVILVDVPIGLPNEGRRKCDEDAMDLLGCRGNSVFYAPPQEAVYAESYEDAAERVEVGIQPPAWGIRKEIRELDRFIDDGHSGADVYEIHPEVCFYGLCGRPMAYSKKDSRGLQERKSVLRQYEEEMEFNVEKIVLDATEHAGVTDDDALDALVASVTAFRGDEVGYEVLGASDHPSIRYVDDSNKDVKV